MLVHNALNRLAKEIVDPDGASGSTAVSQTVYADDGLDIGSHVGRGSNAASSLAQRDLWGPAVEQVSADEKVQVTPIGSPNIVLWALDGHEGAVCDSADNGGDVVDHRVFNSFGEMTETVPATDFLFGYTGKLFDQATGLQNNLNRWYDPTVGRFLSEDPLGLLPDANPYRYVGNAPMTHTDPLGLISTFDARTIYDNIIRRHCPGSIGLYIESKQFNDQNSADRLKLEAWDPKGPAKPDHVSTDLTDLEKYIKGEVANGNNVTIIEIGGHADYSGGITIGDTPHDKVRDDPDPNARMKHYIDEGNARLFGVRLRNDAPNLRLIVLNSCNMGNFADNKGNVPQEVADGARVPVLCPGGFGRAGSLGPKGRADVDATDKPVEGKPATPLDNKTYKECLKFMIDELEAKKKNGTISWKEWRRLFELKDRLKNSKESVNDEWILLFPSWWTDQDKKNWLANGTIPPDPVKGPAGDGRSPEKHDNPSSGNGGGASKPKSQDKCP
jgi:RHS repeat-associated protein